MTAELPALDLTSLRRAFTEGLTPRALVSALCDRMDRRGDDAVWIHRVPRQTLLAQAARLEAEGAQGRPLWGVPVSVKDCNDVPGLPTTNALPASSYVPEATGPAIARLIEAGALILGKTNMDQFGIGLVGMRSPHGAPSSVFNSDYISGGSSSGAAVSVADGLCSIAVANDAAGSGRVPAAFNNIVGVKPTPGLVSNRCVTGGGCVRTIETVSVLALTVNDGMEVLNLMAGHDPEDAFSRPESGDVPLAPSVPPARFSFAIPDAPSRRFFGDEDAREIFDAAVSRMQSLGGTVEEVDFTPFEEAQRLLYEGPWIAERSLSLAEMVGRHHADMHPVTRAILSESKRYSAEDLFSAIHRLAELKQRTRPLWQRADFMMVPTTPTTYSKNEIEAEPFALNARLGIYTNFVNLMGLAAMAVPAGFRRDGPALGITLIGPGLDEARLAGHAACFEQATGIAPGAAG